MKRLIILMVVALALAVPLGASAAQREVTFKSPTGNILCDVWSITNAASDGIQCALMSSRVSVTYQCPDPVGRIGCPLVFAFSGVGRVTVDRGSWQIGSASTLVYGRDLTVGHIRCTSRFNGMTCKSLVTGHGFFLSRQTYRVF